MTKHTFQKFPMLLATAGLLSICLTNRSAEAAYWPTPKPPTSSSMMVSTADSSTSSSQTSGTLTLP